MQAVVLFDKVTAEAFFRCLPEAAAAPHSRTKTQTTQQQDTAAAEDAEMHDAAAHDDVEGMADDVGTRDSSTGHESSAMDVAAGSEVARALCEDALKNITEILKGGFSLREEQETVQAAVDACTAICCSCADSGAHCFQDAGEAHLRHAKCNIALPPALEALSLMPG